MKTKTKIKKHNLAKLNQEEINNLNRTITSISETVRKIFPKTNKQTKAQDQMVSHLEKTGTECHSFGEMGEDGWYQHLQKWCGQRRYIGQAKCFTQVSRGKRILGRFSSP